MRSLGDFAFWIGELCRGCKCFLYLMWVGFWNPVFPNRWSRWMLVSISPISRAWATLFIRIWRATFNENYPVDLTASGWITPRARVASLYTRELKLETRKDSAIADSTTFGMATQTDGLKVNTEQHKASSSVDVSNDADFYWVTSFNWCILMSRQIKKSPIELVDN